MLDLIQKILETDKPVVLVPNIFVIFGFKAQKNFLRNRLPLKYSHNFFQLSATKTRNSRALRVGPTKTHY